MSPQRSGVAVGDLRPTNVAVHVGHLTSPGEGGMLNARQDALPAQLPPRQALGLSEGPKPAWLQPGKHPDNPPCEREAGRGLLPGPVCAGTRGTAQPGFIGLVTS